MIGRCGTAKGGDKTRGSVVTRPVCTASGTGYNPPPPPPPPPRKQHQSPKNCGNNTNRCSDEGVARAGGGGGTCTVAESRAVGECG